jgi:hypothetical protein
MINLETKKILRSLYSGSEDQNTNFEQWQAGCHMIPV